MDFGQNRGCAAFEFELGFELELKFYSFTKSPLLFPMSSRSFFVR